MELIRNQEIVRESHKLANGQAFTSPSPSRRPHSQARNTHSSSAPPASLYPAEESLPPAPSETSHPSSYSSDNTPACTGSVYRAPPARKCCARRPHSLG